MNTNPQESAISLTACGKLIALGLAATGVDLLITKAVNTHYFQLAIIGGFFLMIGVAALVEKGIGMLTHPSDITRQHFLVRYFGTI